MYQGESKHVIEVDVSMLTEEDKVEKTSKYPCHMKESDTKVSCQVENICYSLDISSIAVDDVPSNPVNCYIKNNVIITNQSNTIFPNTHC